MGTHALIKFYDSTIKAKPCLVYRHFDGSNLCACELAMFFAQYKQYVKSQEVILCKEDAIKFLVDKFLVWVNYYLPAQRRQKYEINIFEISSIHHSLIEHEQIHVHYIWEVEVDFVGRHDEQPSLALPTTYFINDIQAKIKAYAVKGKLKLFDEELTEMAEQEMIAIELASELSGAPVAQPIICFSVKDA